MKKWQNLLTNPHLTLEDLKKIPSASCEIFVDLFLYIQNKLKLNLDFIFSNLCEEREYYFNNRNWVNAYDMLQIDKNFYLNTNKLFTHYDYYKIGRNRLYSANSLIKLSFLLLPLHRIFNNISKHAEKLSNCFAVKSFKINKSKYYFTFTDYPYLIKHSIGVICHNSSGVIASLFDSHQINNYTIKHIFCCKKLRNIINYVYAKYKWDYKEQDDDIFLNNRKIGERINIDISALNRYRQVPIPEHLVNSINFEAVLITDNYYYKDRIIFRKNEIYEAPFCLIEADWERTSLLNRFKHFYKSRKSYKLITVKEMEKQIAFSNRKMAELLESKQKVIDIMESLNKRKDEFLATASHELRTPLNGIIGLAEIGLAGCKDNRQKNYMYKILSSGKRLSNLINNILDYSKLKEFNIDLQLKNINIKNITDISLSMLKNTITNKNIIMKNNIPEEEALVYGDENRVMQIINNLLGNAIKFTEEGEITVSSLLKDDMVYISVKDTGIGIPEENLKKIFFTYEQSDEQISKQYGGTGIGLYITKKLIELHGGSINVFSELNKGSVFTFSLPACKEKKKKSYFKNQLEILPEQKQSKTQMKESNENILAVDDDYINLFVIKEILNPEKYNIITSSSGNDALTKISSNKPDCVILDIMMPGINGYDVCKKIRTKYSLYELPVLMVSARSHEDDIVYGFECGVNDYLSKPISRNELLARINTQLKLKKYYDIEKQNNKKLNELEKLIYLGTIIFKSYSADYFKIINKNEKEFTKKIYKYLEPLLDKFHEKNSNSSLAEKNNSNIRDYFLNTVKNSIKIQNEIKKKWKPNFANINIDTVIESTFELITNIITSNSKKQNYRSEIKFSEKHNLTNKESQICELIFKGFSNKEISSHLNISTATVKRHIYNIFNKTGAGNRTHLNFLLWNYIE